MKKILTFLVLGLASIAMAGTGDALAVLNAFLATFAKETPAWKTDITLTSDPHHIPDGRQLGYSAMVGYYTFLPKTWDELTDDEKNAVYQDPRLKSFIVSLRNTQNYPALTSAEVPLPNAPSYPVEGYASAAHVMAAQQAARAAYAQPSAATFPQAQAGYALPSGWLPQVQQTVATPYGMMAQPTAIPAGLAAPTVQSTQGATYYFPVTLGASVSAQVNSQALPATLVAPTAGMPSTALPSASYVPYYMPVSPSSVLMGSPLPVNTVKAQPAKMRVAPEEMLLDRSLNVYMPTSTVQ
jgi:hypothetical protein